MLNYIATLALGGATLGGATLGAAARIMNPKTEVSVDGVKLSAHKKNLLGGVVLAAGSFVITTAWLNQK
ncbi:hypothetical protein [Pseudomonas phage D6]|nr:hypothetical protein [Pseudomonas phage D6]